MHADKYFSWMTRTERQDVSHEITQVYIEFSTHCNLACKTCVRHSIENFAPRHLTKPMMQRIIPMLQRLPKLTRIVLLGFGEALCNPDFMYHLSLLKKCKAPIVLVSNAHFITEKIADFLIELPIHELWLSWDDDPTGKGRIRQGASSEAFAQKIALLIEARTRHESNLPKLGMEMVALRSNAHALPSIVEFGKKAGIEEFIISNIFPYSEHMKGEILYSVFDSPEIMMHNLFAKHKHTRPIRIANQAADTQRNCPFIERGTSFITSAGNIAPCPELAYTHPAWYFGSKRMHRLLYFGNISKTPLEKIWNTDAFTEFRKKFEYYEFPDCTLCREPDMCWHRTVDTKDCYGNETPCGECLWAKGIVLCP